MHTKKHIYIAGFVEGFAVGRPCLERQKGFQGNQEGEYSYLEFKVHTEMVQALKDKKVSTCQQQTHLIMLLCSYGKYVIIYKTV